MVLKEIRLLIQLIILLLQGDTLNSYIQGIEKNV